MSIAVIAGAGTNRSGGRPAEAKTTLSSSVRMKNEPRHGRPVIRQSAIRPVRGRIAD
jgi:hypothetical protein